MKSVFFILDNRRCYWTSPRFHFFLLFASYMIIKTVNNASGMDISPSPVFCAISETNTTGKEPRII